MVKNREQIERELRELFRGVDTTPSPEHTEALRGRIKAAIAARQAAVAHDLGATPKHAVRLGVFGRHAHTPKPNSGLGGGTRNRTGWAWHRVFRWERPMKLAAAAAALALIGVGLWMFFGGSTSTASADFSDVLRHVRSARTVSYDMTCYYAGRAMPRSQVLMASPGRVRITAAEGKAIVWDIGKGMSLTLNAENGRASLTRNESLDPSMYDPLERLRRVHEAAGEFAGRGELNGRQVLAYRVIQGAETMSIWVEPKEEFPVRIEIRQQVPGAVETAVVLDNFRWNRAVDDSLFSLAVPQGYALVDYSDVAEASLVDLLRNCAGRSNGSFPDSLDKVVVAGLFLESLKKSGRPVVRTQGGMNYGASDTDEAAKEAYRECQRGLKFVEKVSMTGEWHYLGRGTKLGDSSVAVCWWVLPGAPSCRVVYGDLRVESRDGPPQ